MTPSDTAPRALRRGDARIAYHCTSGRSPTVVFLCGYRSHMNGTKALYLDRWCRQREIAYLRLDYQGHGASSGRFEDGTIGLWTDDARSVIEAATEGPLVLVGSSMGGWIMILLGLALSARVAGLVGVAAASDFTQTMPDELTEEQRRVLERDGVVYVPSDHDDGLTPITRRFIEEGARHLLLGDTIELHCPVRLLHGLEDPDVAWRSALELSDCLAATDVRVTLVKGGGHRLSAPHELDMLGDILSELVTTIDNG